MDAKTRDRCLVSGDFCRPSVAWPTVALSIGSFALYAFGAYAATELSWNMWRTVPLSSLAAYMSFTPFHDAVHRSVSKDHRWLNEAVGWLSCTPFVLTPLPAFRFLHLRHHKYTNDPELDPDHVDPHLPECVTPFVVIARWLCHLHRHGCTMRVVDCIVSWIYVGFSTLAIAGTISAGKGHLLWQCVVLPLIIALVFLAFFFAILPHRHPHSVRADTHHGVQVYGSTHILDGLFSIADGDSNPLLTFLLLGQNLHAVHHMYPQIPFYTYAAVWRNDKARFLAEGVKLQSVVHSPRQYKTK